MSATVAARAPATSLRFATRLTVPLTSGLLTLAVLVVSSWSFIGSEFLVADDTIFLGRATAGEPLPAQNQISIAAHRPAAAGGGP